MLEISGTCLTPHNVLKTSGHVDRFCDLMTADTVTGECFRADKLLEEFIDTRLAAADVSQEERERLALIRRQADGYTASEMGDLFTSLGIKSASGNVLSQPFPFNLMLRTRIGPKEDGAPEVSTAYLRPETAQGIIVNFRRLLEYNGGRMPFAAAQLGLGFRNEIAPRNALLRVREFQMGEIEYFVHPEEKTHPKFHTVASLKLPLFPRERQLTDGRVVVDMTLGQAVETGVIENESLA